MTNNFVVSMDTKDDGLEVVGGKGRFLAKMTNAGFDVPGGRSSAAKIIGVTAEEYAAENEKNQAATAKAMGKPVPSKLKF